MLYRDIMPLNYVERDYCQEIFRYLSPFFDDNVVLFARGYHQTSMHQHDKKFISILVSAEGHDFIPMEQKHPNCLGVFMHYYPKDDVINRYDPDHFLSIKKLYPLPLGTAFPFQGDNSVPINSRSINVAFIGQLDHRRLDFHKSVTALSEKMEASVFRFYDGWNNGLGSEKYSEIMSNTKIALVPCGSASLDTFRYYEAAKCGCVIISDKQNNYEFMEGAPHIPIDDWTLLDVLIDSLLSKPTDLNKISDDTYSFWEKQLSPAAAADFMLKTLEKAGAI